MSGRTPPYEKELREQFFMAIPRYVYQETLGQGGTGVVFRAEDLELGEEVAIKVLHGDTGEEEEEALARFKRETALNRRVKHPNVARIHDFGTAGPFRYLTMELVPGQNLASLIARRGPLPTDRVVPLLRQVALGTGAAHALGIIHRDLKAQNIMMDEEGGVALLDFGTARRKVDPMITRVGYVVGTITNMSPERLKETEADVRSDIYAIGAVGFHALTGHSPFLRDTLLATALAILNDPLPAAELAHVPPDLAAIVLRCLAKDPDERFATAQELEHELSLLSMPRAVDAASASPLTSAAKRAQDEPTTERITMPVPVPPSFVFETRPVVLVVDDDPEFREIAAASLQPECDTIQANDAEQALALVTSRPVDLVVMDVMMPVMDGFDAVRVLRSQERHAKLPVILVSTFVERNRVAFAMQAGATDFLSKPLDAGTLRERVHTILAHVGTPAPGPASTG
jgi:serine/threonine protein kinase